MKVPIIFPYIKMLIFEIVVLVFFRLMGNFYQQLDYNKKNNVVNIFCVLGKQYFIS